MRRDGRGFDHRTLETIRLMAVEHVRDGERPSSVIASFGFNHTTIYRWLEVASKPGVGLSALRSRPATGRPRSLTPRQERQVGSTNAELFVALLRKMMRHRSKPVHLVIDGLHTRRRW